MSIEPNIETTPGLVIRAVLSIKDKGQSFHIRIEPQGDSVSVASLCRRACLYAWSLPQFEAGDWAAAFLAAAKPQRAEDSLSDGAHFALCSHWWDQGQLDFRYEVTAAEGELVIKAWRRDTSAPAYRLSLAFVGTLEEFTAFAGLEPPAPVQRRYLALFQGPETELFILAFDGTAEEADELDNRLERARHLKLLVTGLVISALGPIFDLGAESIHLALDQLFNRFPPRRPFPDHASEAPTGPPPLSTPPPSLLTPPAGSAKDGAS
ncbi:MAG: hypothetical protein OJJ21_03105 [Ferrovibrio sp.]|uniref:hypothetical protein n=1 Tax=Ferrovibrio sp. TaxID=1917215 RepID=UPI00260782E4|nr:hypothetical protein [Ferrovibrio sp.]MCW0232566.1 hypothetical protein [Ferrovibrio sp.]